MATKELRGRENWQTESGEKALKAEDLFYKIFDERFKNTEYEIINRPKDLKKIYNDVSLSREIQESIFSPNNGYGPHGVAPDFAIKNKKTGKTLYVEVKRQDGWVEGKNPSAGRGNAHERLCKYFTPGLLKIFREKSQIEEKYLPFWVVFVGNITRDPKRVREIHCWFDNFVDHFFLWQDTKNTEKLYDHFNCKLRKVLD